MYAGKGFTNRCMAFGNDCFEGDMEWQELEFDVKSVKKVNCQYEPPTCPATPETAITAHSQNKERRRISEITVLVSHQQMVQVPDRQCMARAFILHWLGSKWKMLSRPRKWV